MKFLSILACITVFILRTFIPVTSTIFTIPHVKLPVNDPSTISSDAIGTGIEEYKSLDTDITRGWQVILDEDFSEAWPWAGQPGWTVTDFSNDNKQRLWGNDQYRYHSANLAVWLARGGRDGRDMTITTTIISTIWIPG